MQQKTFISELFLLMFSLTISNSSHDESVKHRLSSFQWYMAWSTIRSILTFYFQMHIMWRVQAKWVGTHKSCFQDGGGTKGGMGAFAHPHCPLDAPPPTKKKIMCRHWRLSDKADSFCFLLLCNPLTVCIFGTKWPISVGFFHQIKG